MMSLIVCVFWLIDLYEMKRVVVSSELYFVYSVQFNLLVGSVFFCVLVYFQVKILLCDGDIVMEFVKGDMYLWDMYNIKGYILEIIVGIWYLMDKNLCVIVGIDSILWIWDINNKCLQKEVIVFKFKVVGLVGWIKMIVVVFVNLVQGGNNVLIGVVLDGSFVMYSGNGLYMRLVGEVCDVYKVQMWIGGFDVLVDGCMVVLRGGDDMIKFWDMCKFMKLFVIVLYFLIFDYYLIINICYVFNLISIIMGLLMGYLYILNLGNLRVEFVILIMLGFFLIMVDWYFKIN